ncbi:(MFS) transporter [Geosmithia morbida]|uniref:(MFS) transporter n=1 Tax=Geosmithia morbida TaxID=1094350 RepID=A0A9P5CZY9_9HYPO|nr:(MFS) transporter [Geosmithia morbida]KAF4122148.1 (MFS) transporter [Geosmithia morbida]
MRTTTGTTPESDVDRRLPPGTVHLIDRDGTEIARHAQGKGEKDVILVPEPSADPEDPLNWTVRRKILATSCIVVYTITIAIPSSAVYSIVTPILQHTSLDLTDINNGTGIMFLFYGWACIPWQAIALQYGKRPVYLFSLVANIIILATAPLCKTSGTYLANRILLGMFGAPVESLPEISVTDIWFTHERPKYLALYGWSLSLTGKLAPMLSGFINIGMGWEWTLRWCAIWCAMGLVYCFFAMEETNYDRKHTAPMPAAVTETLSQDGGAASNTADEVGTEKAQDSEKIQASEPDSEVGQIQWPRKSYVDKLGFKDKKRPNRLVDIMIGPFKGFTYPAVVWAGLMYGANNLVWLGVQNATIGTVYTTQYGFSTAGVAGGYAGGVIGTIIGGYYCGKVGRLLTIKLARRNGGISEPEHNLYLFIASCILVPFASILYGLGVKYHVHWMALIISQVALSINSSLCIGCALNYAIGSYGELSGQMVTTCILIRNTLSFAVNYGITPWINASGYLRVYCIIAAISLVWNLSFILMVKYGRTLREKTAARYWRDVAHARSKGLGH